MKDTWRQFDTQLTFVLLNAIERKKSFKKIRVTGWSSIEHCLKRLACWKKQLEEMVRITSAPVKGNDSTLDIWVCKFMFLGRNDCQNIFSPIPYDATQALCLWCEHYDTYQCLHHFTTDLMQTKVKLIVYLLVKDFHIDFRTPNISPFVKPFLTAKQPLSSISHIMILVILWSVD